MFFGPSSRGGFISHIKQRWTKEPAMRVFCFWLTLICLFLLYGKLFFYRDPLSMFYDPNRAYERKYSAIRQAQAEEFLEHQSTSEEPQTKASEDAEICLSFVTVSRAAISKQYVDNAVASALTNLTTLERQGLHIKILFADSDPTKHPTWNAPWLRNLFDEVYTYSTLTTEQNRMSRVGLDWLTKLEKEGEFLEKGIVDYSLALDYCLTTTNAPYVAIFEDDVLVADGWFAKTLFGVREIVKQEGDRWGYMRMFNQERSTGWASTTIGGNGEFWISLAIASFLCGTSWLVKRCVGRNSIPSSLLFYLDSPGSIFLTCCIAVPVLVILFFQAGKASLVPPRPGVFVEEFGCCSQGMVFPRQQVSGLVDYLRARRVGKYDLITRDYAWINNLTRWTLYPVQMQHIGIESSIKAFAEPDNDARAVWSMAFESLDEKQLAKEHSEMVLKLYG